MAYVTSEMNHWNFLSSESQQAEVQNACEGGSLLGTSLITCSDWWKEELIDLSEMFSHFSKKKCGVRNVHELFEKCPLNFGKIGKIL